MLDTLIEDHGKPSEIVVCDEDLKGILSDACKKVGIRLTVKKRLSTMNEAREIFMSELGFIL